MRSTVRSARSAPSFEHAKAAPAAPCAVARRRRVLGFDSWTRGAHHFERLVPALAQRGIALKLVHLGSWGNDPRRAPIERIGELEVRDIASYGTGSLERMLDAEAPDAVIFVSIETFAHRALVRYCRVRRIPTLLLYHGLVNVQVTDDAGGSYGKRGLAHARFVCSKLGKVFRRTLPCYLTALVRTRGGLADWGRFLSDALRMLTGRMPHRLAADPDTDATATMCAVYTSADVEHAIRSYAFKPDHIRVVGNPDLMRFGVTHSMLGSRLAAERRDSSTVVYIDTGLVNNGLVFRDQDQFLDHLRASARSLAAMGMTMLLKPHPSHDPAMLAASLGASDVKVLANEELLPALEASRTCIVEPTTLALLPALLGMPLFYASYGDLAPLRYGPVLASYPRGLVLRDLRALPALLERAEAAVDRAAASAWIERNSGPIPVEEMPERVAAAIAALWAA